MGFLFYDLTFLVIFGLFLILFLYKKRKNLKREGILYLYRTKLGIKFINYVGKKYKKTLRVLSYVVVATGYILMIAMIYLLADLVYIFVSFPEVVRAIKVPPLMPLIPYLPSLFKIDFLPPFYFTYWIIAIAIIAISHEFSHGIFARLNKVKIKSTGFGFLGPFLAAFVEPDEKQMPKKSKFSQITILSAGSFANVVMTIIFFILLYLFFILTFAPAGAIFNTYTYSAISIGGISSIENQIIKNQSSQGILDLLENKEIVGNLKINISGEEKNLLKIKTSGGGSYLASADDLESQLNSTLDSSGNDLLIVYDDAPAINVGLKGTIIEIQGKEIKNQEQLSEELGKYKAGDKIEIKTRFNEEILSYEITLEESPYTEGKGFLGIGTMQAKKSGVMGFLYRVFSLFKDAGTDYAPKFDSNLIIFIYNLLWWIIIINISVALVNMLPVGIFDGGRVFFLTMFAITKKEKLSKKLFSLVTYIILLIFLLLMVFWFFSFI